MAAQPEVMLRVTAQRSNDILRVLDMGVALFGLSSNSGVGGNGDRWRQKHVPRNDQVEFFACGQGQSRFDVLIAVQHSSGDIIENCARCF